MARLLNLSQGYTGPWGLQGGWGQGDMPRRYCRSRLPTSLGELYHLTLSVTGSWTSGCLSQPFREHLMNQNETKLHSKKAFQNQRREHLLVTFLFPGA